MWSLPVHPNCYKKKFAFFFLLYKKEKMSNLPTKETKAKFNKLSIDLNIKLIKGNRNFILYMKNYINNEENLKKSLLI